MEHPYKRAPKKSFWGKSVASAYSASDVCSSKILIPEGSKVSSAGSCFAANIIPYLEKAGVTYVRSETVHPSFSSVHKESLSYPKFSAAYGNIYTARHLLQLLLRAVGKFKPKEDRWYQNGKVIDPFRPGLAFPASSDKEFDALTQQHLSCVINAFQRSNIFVFTLGLTEAWVSTLDGAVFPVCPGTVAGEFDPQLHQFKNFTAKETAADIKLAFEIIRKINPEIRFILTVSPVPLVATATGQHVLQASTYSKSALRVAAQEVVEEMPFVSYFPAYEIVTGPQAPYEFFDETRREVTPLAVESVMGALLSCCGRSDEAPLKLEPVQEKEQLKITAESSKDDKLSEISRIVASIECEEAATGID